MAAPSAPMTRSRKVTRVPSTGALKLELDDALDRTGVHLELQAVRWIRVAAVGAAGDVLCPGATRGRSRDR